MQNTHRISELDGVRGIGIILIFLYHLSPQYFPGGFIGVSIFFILSGYLLFISSTKKDNQFSVINFYWRRFSRLYPSLLLFLMVTILCFTVTHPEQLQNIFYEGLSIIGNYNNWYQIFTDQSYFAKLTAGSPLTHLWFLSVLCQFYLLWPIIFFALHSLNRRNHLRSSKLILLSLIGLSVVTMSVLFNPHNPSRVYYGTDTRLFSFLIGSLLGIYTLQHQKFKLITSKVILGSSMIVFIGTIFLIQGQASYLYHGGLFLIDILITYLIATVLNGHYFSLLLNTYPLRWLGQISYELYLCHYPIIYFINKNTNFNLEIKVIIIIALTLLTSIGLFKITHNIKPALMQPTNLVLSLITITLTFFVSNLIISHSPSVRQQQELTQSFKTNQASLHHHSTASNFNTNREITMIGDSVTLGASPSLQKQLPNIEVDAKEGRQVIQAEQIINRLKHSNQLKERVVIALGTNGPFNVQTGQQLIDSIGHQRQIYWVNVYGSNLAWQNNVNHTIKILVKRNTNVHLINWHDTAQNHHEWFYNDGIHLQPFAQPYYATLIKKGIK